MPSRNTDWYPTRRQDQLAMAQQWSTYLDAHKAEFGITAAQLTELDVVIAGILAAHEQSLITGGGSVIVGRLDDLYLDLERLMRALHRLVTARPLSLEQRGALSLGRRDENPTLSPVPDMVPEVETGTENINELHLYVFEKGNIRRGKPRGVYGFEIAHGIASERPGDPSELPNRITATANPVILRFRDDERGLRDFFAARWLNTRLQPGPWSDIESAVIP